MHMSYWRFALMIATSTLVMFGLMYLNTYSREHVLWSEMRVWMALVMGASMGIIMLSYMLNMYQNKLLNISIYTASVLVFGGALWVVRSQATIDQLDYMKAMTPHHSIAILTSERAYIEDSRVRKLADEIIEAQHREIAEMKYLIDDLEQRAPRSTSEAEESQPEPASAAAALESPDLSGTDPGTMKEQDIQKILPNGYRCGFSYAGTGNPIFAVGEVEEGSFQGALKIHNKMVELQPVSSGALADGGIYTAEGIEFEVLPLSDEDPRMQDDMRRRPAHGIFRLEQGLEVGYRGWYSCIV